MSGPFGSSQWMYNSGGFYSFPIEQSLKFNDGDSSYLSFTPTTAGNRRTWTWSGWVKRGNINVGNRQAILSCAANGQAFNLYLDYSSSKLDLHAIGQIFLSTAQEFRDTSAWYHIVLAVDTTQATSSNRLKLYVNGEQVTAFSTEIYPSQNAEFEISSTASHQIGRNAEFGNFYFDGYLSEINFVDGQALDASNFGEFKSGVWIPKEYTGVYNDAGNDVDIYNATTATEYSNSVFTNFLDGNLSTVWGSTGGTGTATVTFSPTLDTTTSCRIYGSFGATSAQVGSNTNLIIVNGTDVTAKFKAANAYLTPTWVDVSTEAGSALSSVSINIVSGVANTGLFALELNGTVVQYIPEGQNGFRLSFQNDTVSEGFNTVTYTGNGTGQSINGLGLAPDLIWFKQRNGTSDHVLFDSVRGINAGLVSNSTNAENTAATSTQDLTAFNSDGFSLGTNAQFGSVNSPGVSSVAWCWDAGSGSPVSNTDGSITSTVKANAAYGFSIITWTGNDTAGATLGHGLNSAPEMFFTFRRNVGDNHPVYHSALGNTKAVHINLSDGPYTSTAYWNDTSPTSSVITLGGDSSLNWSAYNYVGYAFHSVAGYSSVGSYTGTGATGNTITLGFKPAFVMIKHVGASSWYVWDATRSTNNPRDDVLSPNNANAEQSNSATYDWDFTDTGFVINNTSPNQNGSGQTYLYLAFADTRDNAFWRDQSDNGNDWQPNNLTYQDSLPDSTTNNFAVLNTLNEGKNCSPTPMTFQEGNLECFYNRSTSGGTYAVGTMAMPNSGKWYAEMLISAGEYPSFGVASVFQRDTIGSAQNARAYGAFNGNKLSWDASGSVTVNTGYGASFGVGDVVGIAADMDTGELTFYKNGVSQGVAFTDLISSGVEWTFLVQGTGGNTATSVVNFGQDSSFAGNKPAQGNTDDNGYGDFYYAPPSGYLALCTANLPDPVIDPAKDDSPSDYFNTVLWTGNATYPRSITGTGFQPDMVFYKSRSNTGAPAIYDAVRGAGAGKMLSTNQASAEGVDTPYTDTDYGFVSSFDSDGFSINTGAVNGNWVNQSGVTYVGWNWKAGNGTSSNTDGSITSTVSVNQKAGFSVVSHTGNGSNATIGHGLGVAPSMIIHKRRDGGGDWNVYHSSLGKDTNIILNTTAASYSSTTWNNTAPTSSVYSIVAGANTNSATYIAYCFAEVENFSSFGQYTGNGSADGPFIFTGHAPAWLLIKRTDSTQDWFVYDNQRLGYNPSNSYLRPNSSGAEGSGDNFPDLLSNGFKWRVPNQSVNVSGATYIYASFASNPFKYANAR